MDRVQQTWRSEGGRDALRRGKGLEAKPEATNTRTSLSEAGPVCRSESRSRPAQRLERGGLARSAL